MRIEAEIELGHDEDKLVSQNEALTFSSELRDWLLNHPLVESCGISVPLARFAQVDRGSDYVQCDKCERRSYTPNADGLPCNFPQPDQTRCDGTLRAEHSTPSEQ